MISALNFHKKKAENKETSADLFSTALPSKYNESKMKIPRTVKAQI
jgi:hypothetical protein